MENKTKKKKVGRKKPNFLRKDWHKKIKLGSTVKKNRKWRKAKGRHSKVRLSRKGYSSRPKIGWGSGKSDKMIRVENANELKLIGKGQEIVIGKVGLKKRKEIIAEANKKAIKILNRYKEEKNAAG